MCQYRIYDNEDMRFLGISFSIYEMAEDYITRELENDFDRYNIYKKVS